MLQKGIFTISIDFEFAWGYADKEISEEQKDKIREEVYITKRLLERFKHFNIKATWATVAGLLDEGNSRGTDVLWFDKNNLINKIKSSRQGHEVGSHSYEHVIYSDISYEEALRDIEKAKEIHNEKDLEFNSFVFPRNREGNHTALKKSGIKNFRGQNQNWYSKVQNKTLKRVFHLMDFFLFTKNLSYPSLHSSGLVNIPGGQLLISRKGLRRIITPGQMVLKMKNSLKHASREKKVFHLWFHPSNFSYDTERQFEILELFLMEVWQMRKSGEIDNLTMSQIGEIYEKSR